MSAILLENDLLHYEVLGRGKPVFFLHGWFGSWRYWIPAMQAVSLDYRAYAFDLWGFGDSAKNQKYSLAEQAQMIFDFMDKMGIFRAALIGHGLGALVAFEVAKHWPELVDRIMAIACPTRESQLEENALEKGDQISQKLVKDGLETNENLLADAKKNDLAAALITFSHETFIESAQSFEIPVTESLFVYGRQDPFVKCPKAEDFENLTDRQHLLVFEQSGHFPFLEESSKFNRLLGEFLTLTPGTELRDLQLKEEWKRRIR
ncbi:MAG: hypothetical protein BGO78_03560 [Chloroflexi bacterium 44-23]|nr:MAG: hypothetical protein BGO78_03560 [Chloroflexi bacterium 44-23]